MEDNKKHKILNLYDYLQTENCMLYYDINDKFNRFYDMIF